MDDCFDALSSTPKSQLAATNTSFGLLLFYVLGQKEKWECDEESQEAHVAKGVWKLRLCRRFRHFSQRHRTQRAVPIVSYTFLQLIIKATTNKIISFQ